MPREHFLVHIEDHPLVLAILLEAVRIFAFEKTIGADREICRVTFDLPQQVDAQGPQIT